MSDAPNVGLNAVRFCWDWLCQQNLSDLDKAKLAAWLVQTLGDYRVLDTFVEALSPMRRQDVYDAVEESYHPPASQIGP